MTNDSPEPKRDQFWKGPPADVEAWATVDRGGNIMPASVREYPADVMLACGDCVPFRVRISYIPDTEG